VPVIRCDVSCLWIDCVSSIHPVVPSKVAPSWSLVELTWAKLRLTCKCQLMAQRAMFWMTAMCHLRGMWCLHVAILCYSFCCSFSLVEHVITASNELIGWIIGWVRDNAIFSTWLLRNCKMPEVENSMPIFCAVWYYGMPVYFILIIYIDLLSNPSRLLSSLNC